MLTTTAFAQDHCYSDNLSEQMTIEITTKIVLDESCHRLWLGSDVNRQTT